jgi:hypothetical protein
VIKTTSRQELTGNHEELVLKFFAYFQERNSFVHGVKEFLNDYMEKKTKSFTDENDLRNIFTRTFDELNTKLPEGIVRGNRKNATPLVLFEAITIGVADAIIENMVIDKDSLIQLLDNEELRKLTTGATNSKNRLIQRIEFVKRAFE